MRSLILGAVAATLMFAGAAVAGPVTLKANPVDSDGRVTLGDLFDGAGAAGEVVVGTRAGPSIVFEAGAAVRLVEVRNGNLFIQLDGDRDSITVLNAGLEAQSAFTFSDGIFVA